MSLDCVQVVCRSVCCPSSSYSSIGAMPSDCLRCRSLVQPQSDRLSRTVRQSQHTPHPALQLMRTRLDAVIFLKQSDNHIARLCKRKLLPNTNTRASIERQELPPRLPSLKALGFELVRVRSPDVLTAVHDVNGVRDLSVGRNQDRALAVGPSTSRKSRCLAADVATTIAGHYTP